MGKKSNSKKNAINQKNFPKNQKETADDKIVIQKPFVNITNKLTSKDIQIIYSCNLHNPIKIYKSSSALGKHMRTKHGPKWTCKHCKHSYCDKGSHPICKVYQQQLLQKFIKSYFIKNEPIAFMKKEKKPDLSNIAVEKGPFTYFKNPLLGEGHNSKCFYGFDTICGKEIALKFALNHKKIIDYNQEGLIINKLCDNNFYPKLVNFNGDDNKEYLGMTLMGPDLNKLFFFYDNNFFTRKTIIEIGLKLLELSEYLNYHKIVHRDIKPSNIAWGIFQNNTIINKNNFYFIDYGYSQYMGKTFLKEDIKNYNLKGTREYLSINAHCHGIPNSNDDLESIIYTLLSLTEKGLPCII